MFHVQLFFRLLHILTQYYVYFGDILLVRTRLAGYHKEYASCQYAILNIKVFPCQQDVSKGAFLSEIMPVLPISTHTPFAPQQPP